MLLNNISLAVRHCLSYIETYATLIKTVTSCLVQKSKKDESPGCMRSGWCAQVMTSYPRDECLLKVQSTVTRGWPLIANYREDDAFPNYLNYHCKIHQQALCAKMLNMIEIMDVATKTPVPFELDLFKDGCSLHIWRRPIANLLSCSGTLTWDGLVRGKFLQRLQVKFRAARERQKKVWIGMTLGTSKT